MEHSHTQVTLTTQSVLFLTLYKMQQYLHVRIHTVNITDKKDRAATLSVQKKNRWVQCVSLMCTVSQTTLYTVASFVFTHTHTAECTTPGHPLDSRCVRTVQIMGCFELLGTVAEWCSCLKQTTKSISNTPHTTYYCVILVFMRYYAKWIA